MGIINLGHILGMLFLCFRCFTFPVGCFSSSPLVAFSFTTAWLIWEMVHGMIGMSRKCVYEFGFVISFSFFYALEIVDMAFMYYT